MMPRAQWIPLIRSSIIDIRRHRELALGKIKLRVIDKIDRADMQGLEKLGTSEIYDRITENVSVISDSAGMIANVLQSICIIVCASFYLLTVSELRDDAEILANTCGLDLASDIAHFSARTQTRRVARVCTEEEDFGHAYALAESPTRDTPSRCTAYPVQRLSVESRLPVLNSRTPTAGPRTQGSARRRPSRSAVAARRRWPAAIPTQRRFKNATRSFF